MRFMSFKLWFAICIGTSTAQVSIKISGGEEAIPGEFPWILYLDRHYDYEPPHCSAIIITEEWALTAASCLRYTDTGITLIAAEHNIEMDEGTEQTRRVVATVYHPNYTEGSTFANIALLKVSPAFVFNQFVQPAPLLQPTQQPTGNCTTAGWGYIGFNNVKTKVLLKVNMQPLSNESCVESYPDDFRDHLMCTGTPEPSFVGLCFGDEGNPLMCYDGDDTYLGGIGIGWESCGGIKPSLFREVGPYLDWTSDTIENYNHDNITWAESTTCGGVLTGIAGRISYKVGETYEPNERCVWTIRTVPGRGISYRLVDYGLRSGSWVSQTSIVDQEGVLYSSTVLQPTSQYSMHAAVVFITFYAGPSPDPGKGFSFVYYGRNSSDLPDLKYYHDNITADGSLSYPLGGGEYESNELTTWVLNPGPFNAQLNVTRVDIERDNWAHCGLDALRIYSLNWNRNYQQEIVLCGDIVPPNPFKTENGVFIIIFKSDNSTELTGFDFNWEKLPDSPTTTITTTTTIPTTTTPTTPTSTPMTITNTPTALTRTSTNSEASTSEVTTDRSTSVPGCATGIFASRMIWLIIYFISVIFI